jgi:Protein of unknown function (DUF3887)
MTRLAAVLSALLVSLAPALADEPAKGNEALKARAGAVLAALVKKDYEAAAKDFDATMRKKVTPGELKKTWTGLLEKLGPLGKRGEPRLTHEGKYDVVTIRCQFEKAVLDARFAFDADGMVTSFLFRPAKSEVKYVAPAYVYADRFKESEMTVSDGKWALPGTLSLPVGDGPFPALVLLHGSGAQDRNKSIGPNQPFRDRTPEVAGFWTRLCPLVDYFPQSWHIHHLYSSFSWAGPIVIEVADRGRRADTP